jgi:hypothetical protein
MTRRNDEKEGCIVSELAVCRTRSKSQSCQKRYIRKSTYWGSMACFLAAPMSSETWARSLSRAMSLWSSESICKRRVSRLSDIVEMKCEVNEEETNSNKKKKKRRF